MSGQNYIGSKISLISLSDIRYVGILHNINSAESTVALQNVQSFGTEGRKTNPNEEIDPSSNIFDYVVFRGSDIKDLQVFEAPPFYKSDPVILEHQQVVNASDKMQQYPQYASPSVTGYGNYWQGKNTAPQASFPYHASQQQVPQNFPPPSMVMPVPENYQHKTAFSTTIRSTTQEEKTVVSSTQKVTTSDFQEKQEVVVLDEPVKIKEKESNMVDSLAKQVSELEIKVSELSEVAQNRVFKQQQNQKASVKNPTKKSVSISTPATTSMKNKSESKVSVQSKSTNDISTNSNNRRRRNNGGSRNNNNSSSFAPRPDFDFVLSNARFEKGGIKSDEKSASDNILIPDPGQFYDKKKSFFDNISCESKEYVKGNRGKNHQEERKLNLETFGVANSSNNASKEKRHRSRNRGRSRKYHLNETDYTQTKGKSDRVIKVNNNESIRCKDN